MSQNVVPQNLSAEDQLRLREQRVERELNRFLTTPPSGVSFTAWREVSAPGCDLLANGGKRWRPLVMQLTCEAVGGGDRALPFTPLVELVHNGTLIVDDIEDRAEMRRGVPCAHIRYGEDKAINSGNWLYFSPLTILEESSLPSDLTLRIYHAYGEALRRVHLGQALDIAWHRDISYFPAREEYYEMCRLKTGSLARLAAEMGIICADGSAETAKRAGEAVEQLGVAFQIYDDVKNLTDGNPGKTRGDDLVEGKKSLPLLFFIKRFPDRKEWLSRNLTALRERPFDNRLIEEIIQAFKEADALKASSNEAEVLLADGVIKLKQTLPAEEPRSLLMSLFKRFSQ